MSKILIITERDDAHARIVSESLKQKGVHAIRWFANEYLFGQKSNLEIKSDGSFTSDIIEEDSFCFQDIEVVWFRRPSLPMLPKDLHPHDRKKVQLENQMHMRSLWLLLSKGPVWINPFCTYTQSNSKALQLIEAAKVGLSIPETLISNDREKILSFIKANKDQGGSIYKPFSQESWGEKDEQILSLTCPITAEMIDTQEIMGLTPGIYQRYLKKQFEVRATFFGNHCIAVKLHNAATADWRLCESLGELKISVMELPELVQKRCLSLMKKLGIVFGCFDFIFTSENEYIFLEVNEMGQFLWIEDHLPDIGLLDKFCNFLIENSKSLSSRPYSHGIVRLVDILNSKGYENTYNHDRLKQETIYNKSAIL